MAFKLFIGPCVLESQTLADEVAGTLKSELDGLDVDLHFKGSFDKANRSAIDSYRGPGVEAGLKILETIKSSTGLKTITDYHLPEQADEVASVVDVLQVPAFLCRQTDLVVAGAQACAQHGGALKIKKGQFLAPEDTENIVDKVTPFLDKDRIYLTERGTSFGYRTLVVDMASFSIMKSFGVAAIHDATHCVQRPGGEGKTSGGRREFVPTLARAAVAAGADGIFMEAHPDPSKAKSDAATQMPLREVPALIKELVNLHQVIKSCSH